VASAFPVPSFHNRFNPKVVPTSSISNPANSCQELLAHTVPAGMKTT